MGGWVGGDLPSETGEEGGWVGGWEETYHGCVVAGEEETEANLPGRVGLQGLLNGNEVLERLGHFEAFDVEVACIEVGGWVGGWVEEEEAVGMSYWTLSSTRWVGR